MGSQDWNYCEEAERCERVKVAGTGVLGLGYQYLAGLVGLGKWKLLFEWTCESGSGGCH